MRALMIVSFGFGLGTLGCLRDTAYHCTNDTQCGAGNRCEQSVGFCSFPDATCDGNRFSDSAGPFAGQCVDGQTIVDAGIDARRPPDGAMPDAMLPDAQEGGCPAGYMDLPGISSGHKYRPFQNEAGWNAFRTICASHSATAYLAIPETMEEHQALTGNAANIFGSNFDFWIGVNDLSTEGTWVTVRGGAQGYLPWAPGSPSMGANNDDCVVSTENMQFDDDRCNQDFHGFCECEP